MVEHEPETRSERRRLMRRRRFVKRGSLGTFGIVAVIVLIVLVATQTKPSGRTTGAAPLGQNTVLLATTFSGDLSHQAQGLTLFGVDTNGKNPVVLFIPSGTLTQIPGFDSIEMAGKALSFGDPSLEQTTVENLLGIVIDRTIEIDDVTLGTIIDELGGIDVDVQERLYDTASDGSKTLLYPLGRRHMKGAAAVTYLMYRGDGTTELDGFVRAQKVWDGIFAAAGTRAIKLDTVLRSIEASSLDPDDAVALRQIWGAFAARSSDDRTYDVLPGQAVGAGGANVSYQPDEPEIPSVVARDFPRSVPPGVEAGKRSRIELRNGNGLPESGRQAAALLVPAGLKIEVTGNASSFRFPSTRIIVYADDAESLAVAGRIQKLLHVGRVEVGTRGQTVVDVTVVLGRDFALRQRGR
jgi:LCP family protein required for cell wall assembly